MVTKNARLEIRASTTPGKVPSASDLNVAELGLNLVDKKMYSKDASGNVFQIAEPGRDAGKYAAFENFLGSGFQGLGIKDGGRIWFRRDNDKETDFTNVWITRTPRAFAGPATGTAHALRVDTIIEVATKQFEWGLASVLELRAGSAGGGEHCATYSQVVKRGDCSGWALCLENRDFVQNPTTGTITAEMGLFVKGGDPLNRRIGVHMALNAADNLPISTTGVINKIGSAFVVGGPEDYVRVGSMFTFQGDAEVHLDLTEATTFLHDVAIAWQPNHKISVQGRKTVNLDGSRVRAAEVASLFWSSSFETWAYGGVKTRATAGTISGYEEVVINGVLKLRPLYNPA